VKVLAKFEKITLIIEVLEGSLMIWIKLEDKNQLG
jgi:hypothetical protein